MTANELIEALSNLSSDERNLRVYVEDGFDPSDPEEVEKIEVKTEQRLFITGDRWIFLNSRNG